MCDPCLLNGYTGATIPGSNACDWPGPFCGTIENNQWFAFLAPASGNVSFNFNVFNCVQNQGIQAEIYSTNTCNDFVSVSNCWSPGGATQGTVSATGLSPYCTYYLMIDGFAGDFCEFTITTTSCMVPPPPTPISIVGPTQVCPGATVSYSMSPPPSGSCGNNSNQVSWVGIEPNGVIIGPNNEPTVTVQWLNVGVATISASSDNVCFGSNFSAPLPIVIAPIPPTTLPPINACLGECVPCAGQLICTPGLTPVMLQSWLGCDSLVNCIINPIFPVFKDLGQVTLCAPQTLNICGTVFNTCGPIAHTCQNWQGCDSTVIADLAILNPKSVIAPPGVLNCAPGSFVTLDGSASTLASACAASATTAYEWTGPPGGISGPANGPTVNVTKPGQYCLKVIHARGGVSCSETKCVTVVKDDDVPQTPQVSGPNSICPNTPGQYTVTPVGQPAPTGYTWTTSNGTPVTQINPTTVEVNWTTSGTFQICVTANNDCGASNPACMNVNVAAATTAVLSGSGSVCPASGAEVNLTITLTGVGPWTVGYSINGTPQTPLDIPTSPFTLVATEVGTYTLTSVAGSAGCPGTASGTGTVSEYPVPTAEISGNESICQGSGQTADLTVTLTGATPWTVEWAVDGTAQAPFTATVSPHSLPIGQAQAGDITLIGVVDGNGCDGTVSGQGTVIVNTAPTVSNISTECDANNVNYTVTFTINGGTPPYTITPNNGSLAGNVFTSNPLLSGTGYSFLVDDVNGCNPVTVSDDIVVCDCDTKAGTMDLSPIQECGDGPVTASYDPSGEVLDGNDVRVFILHSGSGINIVPPVIGTYAQPEVSFIPGTMSYGTTYYLSAVVGDGDGAGGVNLSDPCLSVSQGTPVVFYEVPTAVLSGNSIVCEGNPANLTVTFTGESPWSITYDAGSGPQTINGITSNPYTLVINTASSTAVTLLDMSDVNCPGTPSGTGSITVNTAVNAIAATTCDLGGTFYTVTITISGGNPASYSVSPNNGQLTGNVFVSNPITAGAGYSFVVNDANNCGPKNLVQTEVFCDCTTKVGQMIGNAIELCGNGPVTAVYDNSNQVLDPDDIQSFILHTNSGANAGTVLATNATQPTFSFNPANMSYGVTYYISAVVGNNNGMGLTDLSDPCVSVVQGTPVTFFEVPTATLSGSTAICEGEEAELSIVLTGKQPFQFTIDGQVLSGLTTTDITYPVTPAATTVYTITGFSDENCPGIVSGQATVQVNTPPVITSSNAICNPDTNTYTVTFSISGGNPASNSVSPAGSGTISGGVFTSNPIASDVVYEFVVSDANGCGTDTITGVLDCNCETFAGTMPGALLDACQNEGIAIFGGSTGEVLDADDVLLYYLHTGSGASLGTVIAINSQAGFNFNPATMQAGLTYYISAVVGNNNGSGGIDLSDFCLSVSPGTPVVWNPLPTVSLVASDAVCEGENAQVVFTMSGTGPYNITYSVNGAPKSSANISSPFTVNLTPTVQTIIQMIAVTDLGAGCATPISTADTILVSPAVSAGTASGNLQFCAGAGTTINLGTLLSNADAGGVWTTSTGATVPNGNVNAANLPVGTHTFTYTVTGTAPCPNDQESVSIVINPLPVANAGPDQATNCDLTEVTLGGTPVSGLTYSWSGGVSNPSSPNPVVDEPGTYTLTVTNAQTGCSSTDVVVVSQTVTLPEPHVTISGVSCFGENDGFIVVDSVTNGLPPYLFSFDGSPFGTQSQFTNLEPGDHTLVLVDAAGCERTLDFFIPEPELVDVELVLDVEGDNNIITLGDSALLTVVVKPAFDQLDTIIWSPEELISCLTCPENWVNPTVQTTFSVTVDKDGCQDSDNLTLYVKKERAVYVPNAFSPNNDGKNDIFHIFAGPQVVKIKSFLVFSRWGEAVFEFYNLPPNDPAFGWDGKHRGRPMDPAVFTWFAEIEFIDGRVEIYEGDVSLMR
jgi:gliding motility-associated-like protein